MIKNQQASNSPELVVVLLAVRSFFWLGRWAGFLLTVGRSRSVASRVILFRSPALEQMSQDNREGEERYVVFIKAEEGRKKNTRFIALSLFMFSLP